MNRLINSVLRGGGASLTAGLVAALLYWGGHSAARGAEQQAAGPPELFLTWQARTLVPASYQGKTLPIPGVAVDLALEVVDAGKFADLSKNEVRWFFNGSLTRSGIGLTNTVFAVPPQAGPAAEISVTVVDYAGDNIEKTMPFPVTAPQVAIDVPYPDGVLRAGENYAFRALPYFWSIDAAASLLFSWNVNGNALGEKTGEDRIALNTGELPPGTDVELRLRAENATNPLEFATASTRLTIQ